MAADMTSGAPVPTPADQPTPDDAAESGGTPGFTICISCLPDGTFNVSTEPLEDEANEDNADGDEADKGKPAKSFGEALKMALEAYKNDGQDADAQLESGYGNQEAPQTVSMEPNPDMAARN